MPNPGDSGELNLKALLASERQYRRLFEAAKDGILILNARSGEIEDVNPFLVELLGYSREEFLGRRLWEVGPFKDVAASKEAFEKLKEKEYIRYDDLPLQTRDGRLVSVEFVSNVYALNGGNVIQCNIRDITARKLLVDELRRAKDESEHANEAKSRFIAMLSHELRTPLNPVMMMIRAWKDENLLPASLLPDLETMLRCLEVQTQLIDDMLDVTTIIRGKMKLEFKPQDVHQIVLYALEVMQDRIDERGLLVVLKLEAASSVVNTDFTRLAQVLWNLTKNAVNFTPDGGTITVSTANQEHKILIEIADTGIGIPDEEQEEIFDAFEQGTQVGPHGSRGVGLGLAIAKGLTELLGGSISVHSEGSGKGARFTLVLETVDSP